MKGHALHQLRLVVADQAKVGIAPARVAGGLRGGASGGVGQAPGKCGKLLQPGDTIQEVASAIYAALLRA